MLQKSGRLVLWEAMFILELHSAETQGVAESDHLLQKTAQKNFSDNPYYSEKFSHT